MTGIYCMYTPNNDICYALIDPYLVQQYIAMIHHSREYKKGRWVVKKQYSLT